MKWEQEAKDETEKILVQTPAYAFRGSKGCLLKNEDGSRGHIRFDDAISSRFRIHLYNGETIEYNSMAALIDAGWVAD